MRERIYAAYEAMKADDAQRQTAKQAAMQALQSKRPRTTEKIRWATTVAAAIVLVALGTVAYSVYRQPVAVISIDGEKAVELQVNRFDKVVAMETENDEITAYAWRFSSYSDAVQAVMNDDDAQADVTVFSQDTVRCQAMVQNLQNECRGVCRAGDAAVAEQAATQGLSCGKYAAFLEWQALDATATVEEARTMTMREIRERIASLSGEEAENSTPENGGGQGSNRGDGQGKGQGSGQGDGQGNGRGNGQGRGQGNGNGNGKHKHASQ